MRKSFYPKLAAENIKKNSKTYIPYILVSVGIIAMFYIMASLAENKGVKTMTGSVSEMLTMGTWVIGIFSVIFLFYVNSFLMKRRKKEFGLYNILGMEKRHIGGIVFFETMYCALICIIGGILFGLLLSKLMYLVLLKLLRFKMQMGFEISSSGIATASALFLGVFFLTFLYNLLQIRLAKPIDLLKGGQTGEKEPKTKLIMAVIGTACLGAAYYISLTTTSPLDVLPLFLLAVILVIIGTYFLFIAGSIAVLKLLRKKKSYYYKSNHFTAVSGMIYRMKQNAAGLASICILATAVLVMISTTVSLYFGMEDILRTRFPCNIEIKATFVNNEQLEKRVTDLDGLINGKIEEENFDASNLIRYLSKSGYAAQNGNHLVYSAESIGDSAIIIFFPLSEYNRLTGRSDTLSDGEVMLYEYRGSVSGDSVFLGSREYAIKSRPQKFVGEGQLSAMMLNAYYIVMPDTQAIQTACIDSGVSPNDAVTLNYYYGFDTVMDDDVQMRFTKLLSEVTKEDVQSAAANRGQFFEVYGGLFFLGIFLGVLFIMATVLIIYYKQISEGYDDKVRFDIMQKVGMSKTEVKSSIRSQVLTVFFLPLVTACIHIAFAFKVITRLLALFNLTNILLFAVCTVITILVFAVFYAVVYALTARAYYKIVR